MGKFNHPYLDLARMQMLRRIRITPSGTAEGTFAGPHKSHYRGTAVEFADYRDYVDGDDIRMVDWKVYARTDKHYVKLFETERNLLSYLLVDTSGSMSFQGAEIKTTSKLEYACRLAAAISYLVIDSGDQVGLTLAGDQVNSYLPPRANWNHLSTLVEQLGQANANGKTDIGNCLKQLFRRITRSGVLIIVSDFLDTSNDLWKSIDLFRKSRFDVILFHVMHPEEVELPRLPLARFREMEGGQAFFNTEPEIVRRQYRQQFQNFRSQVQNNAHKRGCDYYPARTDQDPYMFLKQCFLKRDWSR